MRPINADNLYGHCKFRGDCLGEHCDRCSDYAVEMTSIKNAPTLTFEDMVNILKAGDEDIINGDVIKTIFPNLTFDIDEYFNVVRTDIGTISLEWWNGTFKGADTND